MKNEGQAKIEKVRIEATKTKTGILFTKGPGKVEDDFFNISNSARTIRGNNTKKIKKALENGQEPPAKLTREDALEIARKRAIEVKGRIQALRTETAREMRKYRKAAEGLTLVVKTWKYKNIGRRGNRGYFVDFFFNLYRSTGWNEQNKALKAEIKELFYRIGQDIDAKLQDMARKEEEYQIKKVKKALETKSAEEYREELESEIQRIKEVGGSYVLDKREGKILEIEYRRGISLVKTLLKEYQGALKALDKIQEEEKNMIEKCVNCQKEIRMSEGSVQPCYFSATMDVLCSKRCLEEFIQKNRGPWAEIDWITDQGQEKTIVCDAGRDLTEIARRAQNEIKIGLNRDWKIEGIRFYNGLNGATGSELAEAFRNEGARREEEDIKRKVAAALKTFKGKQRALKAQAALDLGKEAGITIKGQRGTWSPLEVEKLRGVRFYLLESDQWGEDAGGLIVDQAGREVLFPAPDGFQGGDWLNTEYFLDKENPLRPVAGWGFVHMSEWIQVDCKTGETELMEHSGLI